MSLSLYVVTRIHVCPWDLAAQNVRFLHGNCHTYHTSHTSWRMTFDLSKSTTRAPGWRDVARDTNPFASRCIFTDLDFKGIGRRTQRRVIRRKRREQPRIYTDRTDKHWGTKAKAKRNRGRRGSGEVESQKQRDQGLGRIARIEGLRPNHVSQRSV
jgi:hypothetical protein